MYDIWQTNYPDLDGYTWCNADNVPSSRIDYTFVNRNFIYDFEKITLRKIPGTINGKRMSDLSPLYNWERLKMTKFV